MTSAQRQAKWRRRQQAEGRKRVVLMLDDTTADLLDKADSIIGEELNHWRVRAFAAGMAFMLNQESQTQVSKDGNRRYVVTRGGG